MLRQVYWLSLVPWLLANSANSIIFQFRQLKRRGRLTPSSHVLNFRASVSLLISSSPVSVSKVNQVFKKHRFALSITPEQVRSLSRTRFGFIYMNFQVRWCKLFLAETHHSITVPFHRNMILLGVFFLFYPPIPPSFSLSHTISLCLYVWTACVQRNVPIRTGISDRFDLISIRISV